MAGWLLRESGAQHPGSAKPFECGVHGALTIDWIAEQMGHTNGNMIRQHYGTWINEDGPDVVGMLQLALKL
ncbi:hypothetical protein FIV39_18110 [Pseudomonas grimontii]|uniref:Integrase n=1 Tax=Pseudomonas grimontii TaxID=129847 RepID=A0A5C5PGH5_9PSED|nr:hypothetical protein FIV39_18110 [Pseudomonas grimontii]